MFSRLPAGALPVLLLCLLLPTLTVRTTMAQSVDFEQDVLPILEQYCLDCHDQDAPESDLSLANERHAWRGGDSGEQAIRPGDSKNSYLLQRILSENPDQRMPPDSDPLPPDAIETIARWIDDADRWEPIAAQMDDQVSNHWSFRPLRRPELPDLPGTPIDRFVDARLASVGLSRSVLADRRTRLRRLSMIMHGLPVPPASLDAFEASTDDDAWEKLVDEYLDSPRYGERWGTHWLDLVRYGDTHGFETNRERPNAWRYRDWVISAWNQDMPYNEFVRRQLAGDSLGDDVATGFLVAGPYDLVKGQDPLLGLTQRQDELADMINTTGTAFLGLTLGCARCHNHKFDPVSQTDYYAIQAVFAGVQHGERPLPLRADQQARLGKLDAQAEQLWEKLADYFLPAVQFDQNVEPLQKQKARFIRMTIQQTTGAEPCIDELEVYAAGKNVALASFGTRARSSGDFVHPLHKLVHLNDGQYGNSRSWISSVVAGGWVELEFPHEIEVERIVWGRDRTGQFRDRLATAYRFEASLDGQHWTLLSDSTKRLPPGPTADTLPVLDFAEIPEPEASRVQDWLEALRTTLRERKSLGDAPMVYAGQFGQPQPTHRLYRGDPTMPREVVPPAAIDSLSDWKLAVDAPESERRLKLADWIAADENPLTARVIVNRIWQHHFGTGIVSTPSDFGANGTAPTHPELLDWLACELIEHNWSLKHIHRLILNSQTWQQASFPNERGMQIDADSRLLWRFPARRLEAEAIRDSILSVTDQLDLTMGGPGFSAFEVEAENVRHYHPKSSYGPEDWKRMVYMTKVRQERDAVFGVFDCPDFSQVVPRRSQSTTPLQALNLFNSNFVLQQSELLAERLGKETNSDAERVQLAYQLCFGRAAEPAEIQSALDFVNQTDWIQFSRALLNSNEFLFIP